MRKAKIVSRGISIMLFSLLLSTQAFAMEVPVSQTEANINGQQTLTKVFEVSADVDPETLKEEGLELNGYSYTLTSFTKEVTTKEDHKFVTVEKEYALTATNELDANKEVNAPDKVPMTITYEDAGYAGTLVRSAVLVDETGRSTKSGTKKVTKSYTVAYNDESLIPSTITESGTTYKRASVSWADGSFSEDSTIPDNYVATATYTRGYSYSTVDGYKATATYMGEVELTDNEMVRYTVQYVGTPSVDDSPNSWVGTLLMWLVILAGLGAIGAAVYLLAFKKKGATEAEGEEVTEVTTNDPTKS